MTQKIALITGASRGLGRNMALHLANRGVRIVGTYRSGAAEAETLRHEIEAMGGAAIMLPLDVTDPASFAAFAKDLAQALQSQFGGSRSDFLIDNAGNGLFSTFAEETEAQFDSLSATHLRGRSFWRKCCCR